MSSSEAELTLILRARNLADTALREVHEGIDTIGTKARGAAGAFTQAFGDLSSHLASGLGNLVGNILGGQDIGAAFAQAGAAGAGLLVETFGAQLLTKLAGSTFVTGIASVLAGLGSTIGGVVAAAIPVGMALLPALLVAALVAAVVFLINNPQIAGKVLEVAGNIVRGIIGGIVALPGLILDVFLKVFIAVNTALVTFIAGVVGFFLGIPLKLIGLGADIVRTIVGGLVSLPGRIADVVREAFANLKIDVGPFHIRSTGVTIDLPNLGQDPRFAGMSYAEAHGYTQHQAGGWAGLHGPEFALLGERGPEYVIPNDQLSRGSGGGEPSARIVGISADELVDMIERGLYFRLRRAPATLGGV